MLVLLRRRALWAAALAMTAGLLAGCGEADTVAGRQGAEVTPVNAGAVPSTLLNMTVTQEESSEYVKEIDRTYLEQFSLFSIREGDLLQATLQISKFTDDADYTSASFRARVVDRVGAAKAQLFRMGDHELYMTVGTKQQIGVWFDGPYMYVMSVRDDFKTPRALVREALRIKL